MSSSADLLSAAPSQESAGVNGISHLAVNVPDVHEAQEFYCGVLGFEDAPDAVLPECGTHAVVAAASGQRLALCLAEGGAPSAESAVHNAFRVSEAGRAAIVSRLDKVGIEVFYYREVRTAEAADNCYFHDPAGNRIQLVVAPPVPGNQQPADILGIDHAVIQAIDVEWEEDFYLHNLGMPLDGTVGLRTADYVLARAWKEGKEDMLPGTMRLDKRYSTIHGTDPVPRPNIQFFFKAGRETLGVYLAHRHYQHPPEGVSVGTPRVAFQVSPDRLKKISLVLESFGCPATGPVEHPSRSPRRYSLYCREPGANFIEFCC